MSGPETIDTSSGEPLTGITLKAPAGSTVVTPATTILEAQPDIEPAQLAIALEFQQQQLMVVLSIL
jgi:hypothetical protein